LLRNVFWIAEGIAGFGSSHSAVLPSPTVDVLKKVMVHPAVMGSIELSVRQGLFRAERRNLHLESLERVFVSNVEEVS
jgi:hypothetical protein